MRKSGSSLLIAAALVAIAGVSVTVRAASMSGTSLPPKDQARMAFNARQYYGGDLVELAQAGRPQPLGHADDLPPRGATVLPAAWPFGPRLPFAMHAPPPFPPTRTACEERINRHAAIAGYIKSKLNLKGSQKDAWRKIEEAAEPAVAKLRENCAQLPATPGAPPSFPDMIDFAAKQMEARATFLTTVSAPLHALYETLSPDQRAALVPPAPPF